MSDDRKSLIPYRSSVPAVTPSPSVPSLPASSGAFLGTRTRIARKDKEFVDASTALIEAKEKQCRGLISLLQAYSDAGLTMARLQALPEVAQHEYDRGRAERSALEQQWLHNARVVALDQEREEIHALAELERAKQRLADVQPPAPLQSTPPPLPATAKGLTPAEVQMVAQRLPDLSPETIETLHMMLSGLLAEKNAP